MTANPSERVKEDEGGGGEGEIKICSFLYF